MERERERDERTHRRADTPGKIQWNASASLGWSSSVERASEATTTTTNNNNNNSNNSSNNNNAIVIVIVIIINIK